MMPYVSLQEIRSKRETELNELKRILEEEVSNREAAIISMKQKHAHAIQELNDQMDALRKVCNHITENCLPIVP